MRPEEVVIDNVTPAIRVEELPGHHYCVVSGSKRLIALFSFLKSFYLSKRVVVFFLSRRSLKYHLELLKYIQVDCLEVHDKQSVLKRKSIVFDFMKAEKGVLLCTNDVITRIAACWPDFYDADWVVLYEPIEPMAYFRLVCRTVLGGGRAMLFLTPEEFPYLCYLKSDKIQVEEWICDLFDAKKLADLGTLKKTVAKNNYLKKLARSAYESYLSVCRSSSIKGVYNADYLDLKTLAASFLLASPPRDRCKKVHKVDDESLGRTGSRLTCPPGYGVRSITRTVEINRGFREISGGLPEVTEGICQVNL